jgi:hypothetical protein
MTRDEIMALDEDGLRVEIAKAKGWMIGRYISNQKTNPPKRTVEVCYEPDKVIEDRDNPFWTFEEISTGEILENKYYLGLPLWTDSIAEAYELEAEITDPGRYLWYLAKVVTGLCDTDLQIREMRGYYPGEMFALIHATPAQRARAYLLAHLPQ